MPTSAADSGGARPHPPCASEPHPQGSCRAHAACSGSQVDPRWAIKRHVCGMCMGRVGGRVRACASSAGIWPVTELASAKADKKKNLPAQLTLDPPLETQAETGPRHLPGRPDPRAPPHPASAARRDPAPEVFGPPPPHPRGGHPPGGPGPGCQAPRSPVSRPCLPGPRLSPRRRPPPRGPDPGHRLALPADTDGQRFLTQGPSSAPDWD